MKTIVKKYLLMLGFVALCMGLAQAQPNQRYRPAGSPPPPPAGGFRADRPAPQSREERMERLETAKIAFITQRIDLSTREAEKFWPVYNQYQNELRALLQQRKADFQKQDALSANDKIDLQLDMESKLLELKKRYTHEFGKVLPAEKIVSLFQAERDFKNELIRELRERKQ
ncbi:MAG: hypothetical protein ACKOWL_06650 [Sphingobacteriaceae bacterium]